MHPSISSLYLIAFSLLTLTSANPAPTLLAPRATATTCAADNCLRALSNAYTASTPAASAFCSTYTTSTTNAIPTYATSGCASNPSRVSSACSCLATSYGQPKPFHKVYGPTDNTTYTIYDQAFNIRSDDYYGGSYDYYKGNCEILCGQGNTYSFVDVGFYLCYCYMGLFNASEVTSSPGARRNEVYQRYQN